MHSCPKKICGARCDSCDSAAKSPQDWPKTTITPGRKTGAKGSMRSVRFPQSCVLVFKNLLSKRCGWHRQRRHRCIASWPSPRLHLAERRQHLVESRNNVGALGLREGFQCLCVIELPLLGLSDRSKMLLPNRSKRGILEGSLARIFGRREAALEMVCRRHDPRRRGGGTLNPKP